MKLEEAKVGMRVKTNIYSDTVWVIVSIVNRTAAIAKVVGNDPCRQVIDIGLLEKED